jgi:cell volume regulation protein A
LNRIRRKKIPAGRLTSVCGIDPVVTRQERMFYDEISFFLKTFFFVYIGLSLDVKNIQAVALGIAIAGLLMFTRKLSSLFLRALDKKDRFLVNSLFARGIASAVIILMAIRRGLDPGSMVIDTVYMVITATIVLSSIRVYFYNYRMKKIQSANKKSA